MVEKKLDITLACVASVSNRVIARKLERKRKKKGVSFLFLLSSHLSRRTRAETLATQANITLIFD